MRRTMSQARRLVASIAPSIAALLLAACVTERTPAPTYGVHTTSTSSSNTAKTQAPTTPVTLPSGPLGHSVATQSSLSTRVRASLMDLGTVSFDGLVLPLVSPDGRFIAVQDGEAPTWPTLLAAPGAEVPSATRVVAYSLPDPSAGPGQPPAATPLSWSTPLPPLLLGRSADITGFLVEAPQPDGSRWIGHVAWISGTLTWIVRGAAVNSYAVLGPDGELAYCRRAVDSDSSIEVVVRPSLNDPREYTAIPPGGGYLFPLFADEPGVVYAFSLVAGTAELQTLKIPRKGDPPALVIVGRQPILREAGATTVYQMIAAVQVPLPRRLTTPAARLANKQVPDSFDKLLFFHAGQGRVCVYDRKVATLVPLFAGSVAASPILSDPGDPASPHSGYLITRQTELEYVPWAEDTEFDRARGIPAGEEGVSVLKGGFVPRLTSDPRWPAVLLGPAPAAAGSRIHLFRLRLEGAEWVSPGRR